MMISIIFSIIASLFLANALFISMYLSNFLSRSPADPEDSEEHIPCNRFSPANRSEDAALEDRHCEEMRKLGAIWLISEHEYVRRHFMDLLGPDPDEKVVVVGWVGSDDDEKGGIWVLSTTRREANCKGVGRVKSGFNMEERCRVIESLGGVFYASPMDCPDLDLRPATLAGSQP
ncbi:hypothetical protein N7510_007061 [Penicillium lagena]|uniref:uncharacterized protein n=1 Tax=Penicillium lagena TaxID=94218 RepID=UPI002541686D|nr:uncharacterized protein N7510_007061 [Penicillium lagena]KAJ5610342.1 hypothetical protein N7510_007061 [Penicillium lagena]